MLNPSMETTMGDYPMHWAPRSSAAVDTEIAYSGSVSLKVIGPTTLTYSYQHLPLRPDADYVLSAWVKTENVSGRGIGMRYAQLAPTSAVWNTSMVADAPDWTQIEFEFHTPPDHEHGRLDLVWELNEGGVAWIDDVFLAVKPGTAAWPEPPEITWAPAEPAGMVRVELATATAGAEIRYTDDGDRPSADSRFYTGPFQVPAGQPIRARAFHPQRGASDEGCAYVGPDQGFTGRDPWGYFPLGVFEDANRVGSSHQFEAMLQDLSAHGLDAVIFVNNWLAQDVAWLDRSDCLGFHVFMSPTREFNQAWWPDEVPAAATTVEAIVAPLAELAQDHPSLRGYNVVDEPGLHLKEKVALATQAFQTLDPARIAMPVLIGIDRIPLIFAAAQPDVMLLDVYPAGYHNPIGDFTMTGFGYPFLDFVSYIRLATTAKPADMPLWLILQTHSFGNGEPYSLREPTPAEVRAQHWLGIGEGATGIFWFVYSSQQDWTGLADNPPLYREVADQAQRTKLLRDLLLVTHKGEENFSTRYLDSGEGIPYAGALHSVDDNNHYVVVVNTDMERSRTLAVESVELMGQLLDLESGTHHELGEALELAPGNGRVFELVQTGRSTVAKPAVMVQAATANEPPFGNLVEVTLQTESANAELYYTLDGSLPTRRAARYTEPFLAVPGMVLRARAFRPDHNDSEVVTATLVETNHLSHRIHLPMVNH